MDTVLPSKADEGYSTGTVEHVKQYFVSLYQPCKMFKTNVTNIKQLKIIAHFCEKLSFQTHYLQDTLLSWQERYLEPQVDSTSSFLKQKEIHTQQIQTLLSWLLHICYIIWHLTSLENAQIVERSINSNCSISRNLRTEHIRIIDVTGRENSSVHLYCLHTKESVSKNEKEMREIWEIRNKNICLLLVRDRL